MQMDPDGSVVLQCDGARTESTQSALSGWKKMKQPFILKADYQPTDHKTGVYLRGLLLSPAGLHTDGDNPH